MCTQPGTVQCMDVYSADSGPVMFCVWTLCSEAGPTASLRGAFNADMNKIMKLAVPTTADMDLPSSDLDAREGGQIRLSRLGTTSASFSHPAHAEALHSLLSGHDSMFSRVRNLRPRFALGDLSTTGAAGSEVGLHRGEPG